MYEYTLAKNVSQVVTKRTQTRDALFVYLQHSSYQDMLDKYCVHSIRGNQKREIVRLSNKVLGNLLS